MPAAKRGVETGLLRKGFTRENRDHHVFKIVVVVAGRHREVITKTSHGSARDLDDGLLSKMARQCHLSRAEFDALVRCPMSAQEYERLLQERLRSSD